MEGNVKVHVESRTRLPDMEDVLHFRGSGTLERTPSGWQLRYQARSDEDGSLMTSELWLEDCGAPQRQQLPDAAGSHRPHCPAPAHGGGRAGAGRSRP